MHACGYSGAKAGKRSVTPPAALVKRNILQQMLVRTIVDNTDLLEIFMLLTEMPLLSSKQKPQKSTEIQKFNVGRRVQASVCPSRELSLGKGEKKESP